MKKFALAAVAAAALSAGVAQAYTVGTFSNGVVVPNVIHNGSGETTAVGLINGSNATIPVFWTFFDQNSKHVTDGCFGMTANQYRGFNWSAESGTGLEGKRGYLVFAVGTNTANVSAAASVCGASGRQLASSTALSANAFHVQLGKSVAYTPVIDGPLTVTPATSDLTNLHEDSLVAVAGAANRTQTLYMRYFIDGQKDGNDTRIAVWSVGNQKNTHTVNIYDDAQNRKSVNFDLAETELSWFDPESIAGRPANFVDGFIAWNLPSSLEVTSTGPQRLFYRNTDTDGVILSYSTIIAPAFGAVQTLLGAHR